jgi:hypothetical protein
MSVKRNMNWTVMLVGTCAALCSSAPTTAYEVQTHAVITANAYMQSNFGSSPQLQHALGLDLLVLEPRSYAPFFFSYFDVLDDRIEMRISKDYETEFIQTLTKDSGYLLQDWLMRGVIREDELVYGASAPSRKL